MNKETLNQTLYVFLILAVIILFLIIIIGLEESDKKFEKEKNNLCKEIGYSKLEHKWSRAYCISGDEAVEVVLKCGFNNNCKIYKVE